MSLRENNARKEPTPEEVGQLFVVAILAMSEGMRKQSFVPYAEEVAKAIIKGMPKGSILYHLQSVRHLFVRAIDIHTEGK